MRVVGFSHNYHTYSSYSSNSTQQDTLGNRLPFMHRRGLGNTPDINNYFIVHFLRPNSNKNAWKEKSKKVGKKRRSS